MATAKKIAAEVSPSMVISHPSSISELNSKKSESTLVHEKSSSSQNDIQPPGLLNFLWREVEKLVDVRLEKKEHPPKITNAIFIRVKDQVISVNLNDVLWVEAYGDYVNFFTEKARYIVHTTMKAIEARLPIDDFARVHRSFIIRMDKIELIEESLIQIGKKLIPIGESYRLDFFSRLDIL